MAKPEDWWPSGRAALLVVLGLATGTAVVQRPSEGTAGAPARSSLSGAAAARSAPNGGARGLAATQPVVALLADALGVDLEGTKAREAATAWRDYLCLKMGRGPNAAEAKLVAALDVVLADLGAPARHVEPHPSRNTVPSPKLPDAVAMLRAYATSEGADADLKKGRMVVFEYLDEARHRPTIERVETAASHLNTRLDTFIAMLPDYVDSQTRRLFDSGLAGIQEAAGALNYSLDRFYLPDLTDPGTTAAGDTSAHELEPGALLFRTVDEDGRDRLLLVLVVTEMPTLGMHRGALSASIALIDAWHAAKAKRVGGPPPHKKPSLKVLGPFFSGSVSSLKDTLQALDEDGGRGLPRHVEILTGSATDPQIGLRLRSVSLGKERVHFHAIVPNSLDVNQALLNYLGSLNPRWSCGHGVALMVEGNTAFGLSVMKLDAAPGCAPPRPPLRVTFPLHVSRLRGATDSDTPAPSLLAPPAVRLKMSETAQPKDLIPALTPDITASVVDSALDNLLWALKRERYSAIGIFATDARDHLFLARKIAKIVPDVLMFGTQSDLLYVNPEYAPFLRGTLIASSYPLFNETQLLTPKRYARARRQFTTATEQGTYNATILLMASLLGDPTRTTQLVDATPIAEGCLEKDCPSPVWLSVVGSNAMWPIVAPVVDRVRRAEGPQPRAEFSVTVAPSWAVAAAVAVFSLALAHILGLYFTFQDRSHFAWDHARRRHRQSLRYPKDLLEAARAIDAELKARCDWQRTRLLWNLYPPSHVVGPPHRGSLSNADPEQVHQ